MSDFVTDFLKNLRQPTVRADAKSLADLLGVPNCGNSECPIHGGAEDDKLTEEDMVNLTASQAEDFAAGCVASAQNALLANQPNRTMLMQTQAMLWGIVADVLRSREDLPDTRKVDEMVNVAAQDGATPDWAKASDGDRVD